MTSIFIVIMSERIEGDSGSIGKCRLFCFAAWRAAAAGLILAAFFANTVFAKADDPSRNIICWQEVVEQINHKSEFCKNDINGLNQTGHQDPNLTILPSVSYVFTPGDVISFHLNKLPMANSREIEIEISEFKDDLWQKRNTIRTTAGNGIVKIGKGMAEKGFFRFIIIEDSIDGRNISEVYAIICNEWKKDILAFCQSCKNQIEANPDSQLVRSSLAVSHFDHTMNLIASSKTASRAVLGALTTAINAKKTFEAGGYPDFVIGVNKIRLKRFMGEETTDFIVVIPTDYNPEQRWPVMLTIYPNENDAAEYNNTAKGLINIWWHFPPLMEYNWKDYEFFLSFAKERLNIDTDRIFLFGRCSNGIAGMNISLHYPDEWAAAAVSLGNSCRHLAGNALNLPFVYGINGYERSHYASYCNFAVKCFEFYGCKYFQINHNTPPEQSLQKMILEGVRRRNPSRVLLTADSLQTAKAYWVQIKQMSDENFTATIDASVESQKIYVKTCNVDSYQLQLNKAGIDCNEAVEIVENGGSLGLYKGSLFLKESDKYKNAKYLKNENMCGTVSDAFMDSFAVIYGTGGDSEFNAEAKKVAEELANGAPCIADINASEDISKAGHVILIGLPKSGLWISEVCKQLPVTINGNQIKANNSIYSGKSFGFIVIHPNPINPAKYLVVAGAIDSTAISAITGVIARIKEIRPADVCVFEINDGANVPWHILEKFDGKWEWNKDWGDSLLYVEKKHPKWQWCQWLAGIVREELNADIVMLEDPGETDELVLPQQIAYRNLFNNFENSWLVKVKIDGGVLRRSLIGFFDSVAAREAKDVFVAGLELSKEAVSPGKAIPRINDLIDGKNYTVVVPSRCINGERLGFTFNEYQLVSDDYLMRIVKNYLLRKKPLKIDGELDAVTLNVL